ncbi:MAG: tRNA-intron lyase [Candidatus Pacearchaeota archaeon]
MEKKFRAYLIGNKIVSNATEAFSLNSQSYIGDKIENKIHYSFVEILYLLKKGKVLLFKDKKKISSDAFMKIAEKKEHNFFARYIVYSDLKNRGYIVKTALKFGADFRVYEKGKKPGEEHAKWVVFAVYETDKLTWYEFAAKNRVAHSTKKNLLIAIVDAEGDITYYECRWLKP